MCSTPPAICTSSQSAAMLMAASLIAWRLDAQLRLIVTPPVSIGRPATSDGDPGDVEALLPLLLDAAPADVLDQLRVDAGPLDQRPHGERREVFRPDVAKIPLSDDARPTGVRTASMTTACLMARLHLYRSIYLFM